MIQDALQLGEMSSSSRSDLVEVVFEAAEIEGKRPMMQNSMHPDGPLSHATSDLVDVVSEETESEAVRLLAARVPPELFENILFYVNVDRVSRRAGWGQGHGRALKRNQGAPSAEDTLIVLKQCSLVCMFWANICREHMFSEKTLKIDSYEDAEIFRRYIVGGCPKLTPVHQLISEIWARQDYQSRRSFLHLLNLLIIKDKLKNLFVDGPVPYRFNPAKLDTPHWGIPPCIVVPSSFLQTNIFLEDIHLPSFYHIIKYIRHFSCATFIWFHKITWNGQVTLSLPHISGTLAVASQRRPRSLRIRAEGVCTNSVHLALTALMLNPNCPLHRISDEERVWMIKFTTLLWSHKENPAVDIKFDVSEEGIIEMRAGPFRFVSAETLTSTDRSVSALSVAGMHAYIQSDCNEYISDKLPANFGALVNHVRAQPTIRALVLLFDSFEHLQHSMKDFVDVLGPATETIELVLAYEEGGRKAVGVDLVTLEPNGRFWTDLLSPTASPSDWHLKSLAIIQRQLKTRKWTNVH